jgi:hypothetical protein
MTYKINVPFEVDSPISASDPDVRWMSRVPGFVRLEPVVGHDGRRYELTFEVEGGSLRDAMDAAEEQVVDYENALGAYHPRMLSGVAAQTR